MGLRPASEIKEALLIVLKKVEESVGTGSDNPDVAELKHIVEERIATLDEVEHAEPPQIDTGQSG